MSDVTVTMSEEAKSYLLDRAQEWFAPEADEIVTALRNAKSAGERYEPVEDGEEIGTITFGTHRSKVWQSDLHDGIKACRKVGA